MSQHDGEAPDTSKTGAGTQPETAGDAITRDQLEGIITKKTAAHRRQLEKAVNDAVSRTLGEVADKFGIDPDGLDEFAEKLSGSQDPESVKSTYERKLSRLQKQTEDWKAKYEGLLKSGREKEQRIELNTFASELGCNDADLLHSHLLTQGLLQRDGEYVSGDDLKGVVNEVLTAKPHLKVSTAAQGGGSRPSSQSIQPSALDFSKREDRRLIFEQNDKFRDEFLRNVGLRE